MRIRKDKGFTLVELMVVMAIIAILTAIVVNAVTGVTTRGGETAKAQDILQVQGQVDRFNSDSDTWPTLAGPGGVWAAGELPSSGNYAGIDWNASPTFGYGYGVRTLYPNYVKRKPLHALETADDSIRRWRIDSTAVVSVEMDDKRY